MKQFPYYQSDRWKIIAQTDLPYLPTPAEVIEQIFVFLRQHKLLQSRKSLIDLGAGDGRVILLAAQEYGLRSVGLEINKELIRSVEKKIQNKNLIQKCEILERDLYDFDVSTFDIVFCFVLPSSHRHFRHVVEHFKEDALVISIRYDLNDFGDLLQLDYAFTDGENSEKMFGDDFQAFLYRKTSE